MDMENNKVCGKYLGLIVIVSLTILPSCKLLDWFRGKPAEERVIEKASLAQVAKKPEKVLTGDVIVSMNGRAVVTTDSLAAEKEKLFKSNPQIKSMIAFMDEKEFYRNLAEGLMNQEIVTRYIKESSISETPDYKEDLQEGYQAIERMINTKYFSQTFDVSVSASAVRDFYEKNKEVMPNLLISRGGIASKGVEFGNEAQAKEFLAKVAEQKDIDKAAKSAGLKVKDFKLVHAQSLGIETGLRNKIVAMKAVPSTELLTVNNRFWVVSATKKEEAKYRPFEQVQENIKEFLAKEKRAERFDQEINRLKSQYNVVINEDYFKADKETAGAKTGSSKAQNNNQVSVMKITEAEKSETSPATSKVA